MGLFSAQRYDIISIIRKGKWWIPNIKIKKFLKKKKKSWSVVVYTFKPSSWEAESGEIFVISRPVWSTERVLGQPRLHRKTLSWTPTPQKRQKERKKNPSNSKLQNHIFYICNKIFTYLIKVRIVFKKQCYICRCVCIYKANIGVA